MTMITTRYSFTYLHLGPKIASIMLIDARSRPCENNPHTHYIHAFMSSQKKYHKHCDL